MKAPLRVPFVGGSYELARKKADVQRSINLCPTFVESGTGKTRLYLESVPGLVVFSHGPTEGDGLDDLAFRGEPWFDGDFTGGRDLAQAGQPFYGVDLS